MITSGADEYEVQTALKANHCNRSKQQVCDRECVMWSNTRERGREGGSEREERGRERGEKEGRGGRKRERLGEEEGEGERVRG